MNAETRVLLTLKGRVRKDDLKVFLTRTGTEWVHPVDKVTVNGTMASFTIPPCLFQNEEKVRIQVTIQYKEQDLQQYHFDHLRFIDGKFCSELSFS